MRKFYFVLLFLLPNIFVFGQCTVPGSHNGWTLPGLAINTPHNLSSRGEFKVHCGSWPGGSNAWYMNGSVTFQDNGITGRAFGDEANFTVCAPGVFSGWNNTTAMTQTGNQWCYTVSTPGTYSWKPTRCGSWDSWDPSGQRSVNASDWSVTTTAPNQQVCVTYNPSTGEVGMQVVLPVKIKDFIAKRNTLINNLFWTTASENNNEYFEVQHSTDGRQFEAVGQVKGYGYSTSEREYEFSHEVSGTAISYYRLKQVDFDGKYEYSGIISVRSENDRWDESIAVSPNPVADFLLVSGISAQANYMITDYLGRQLMTGSVDLGQGLDVSTLSPGFYMMVIQDGTQQSAFKWIKQ
jgi:Secretion system C-terminal sorting domain